MQEYLQRYFSTGEFATLCHVKKQTLFHYDEIGLLSPEIKKANGYRYYSYNQFEKFNVIQLLKEVGVPLKEMKELFKKKTPEEMTALLRKKSLEIEERIKRLEHLKEIVDNKVLIAESSFGYDYSAVELVELEEETLYISGGVLGASDRQFVNAISSFLKEVHSNGYETGYPIGAMVGREQLLAKDFYNYNYLFMKIKEGIHGVEYFIKPKGLYITAYQIGMKFEEAYKAITAFAEENELEFCGYSYEEYVLDEFMANGKSNQVTRVQVHVKSKN